MSYMKNLDLARRLQRETNEEMALVEAEQDAIMREIENQDELDELDELENEPTEDDLGPEEFPPPPHLPGVEFNENTKEFWADKYTDPDYEPPDDLDSEPDDDGEEF
jgi:hypothetical protein